MLLYYITDRKGFAGAESDQRAALLRCIAEAARAGVDYIQLREKDLGTAELEQLTREAVNAIRHNSATAKLLINGAADIAIAINADGVHLPAGSATPDDIKAAWIKSKQREPLIGVSAHSVGDVERAASNGADFAVLAPVFEKAGFGAKGMGVEVLRQVCEFSSNWQNCFPVLALGGVTLANARACLDAGAAGVAGIRLFQQGDVAETVIKLRAMSGLQT
jgi:thiamine-phosphate pyrophosphorylase